MVIVAVSDQHLGYEKADKAAFDSFLDQLRKDPDITDLVLLGDVVDMWRRDASGVFLENRDTFDRIASLSPTVRVHYVYGNHDFHLRELRNHSYPFTFTDVLVLSEQGRNYRFVHGYQFDDQQVEPVMELLCRAMSDDVSNFGMGVWDLLTRDWTFLDRMNAEHLRLRPEDRLAGSLADIERRACDSVKPGEILVFGHTHSPFINRTGTVVNTGSWVTDSDISNTYARLEAGGPRLFIFEGGEITERVQC